MEKFKVTVDDKGRIEVWMDGCVISGIREIDFHWEVGEIPYHRLEFVSPASKIERKYSKE